MIGFRQVGAIVAVVSLLGLLVTVTLLPEPKGVSLEELTETGPHRASSPPRRDQASARRA